MAPSKKLNQLSTDERDKLCAYRVEVEQAPRTVTCGNNPSVTLKDKASCLNGLGQVSLLDLTSSASGPLPYIPSTSDSISPVGRETLIERL